MSYYTGLTIGPIYKTLAQAKRTREFWAASYTFSLLAEYLIEALKENGVKNDDFILPNVLDINRASNSLKGVGIYPDKIIFEGKVNTGAIIETATQNLSEELQVPVECIRSHFKVYSFTTNIDSGPNPLDIIDIYLNQAELQNKHHVNDDYFKPIASFFKNINIKEEGLEQSVNTFLKRNFSRPDSNGNKRIPSIVEIATEELQNIIGAAYRSNVNRYLFDKDDESAFIQALRIAAAKNDMALKKKLPSFKTYHKYIAILKADGDKMGETLASFKGDKESIRNFSGNLIGWGKDSHRKLSDYSALPVYIGGDDILCFAPIANKRSNILMLIKDIRDAFYNQPLLQPPASLRFGLAIAYYKHPMAESLSLADDLLSIAKDKGGNCIALNFRKHSGAEFNLTIDFETDGEKKLFDYLTDLSDHITDDKNFVNSVMYVIRENQALIEHLQNKEARLWNFFQNNFEEADKKHAGKPAYKYLESVKALVIFNFSKYGKQRLDDSNTLKAIAETFSALRFVKFIKGLDDDRD